MVSLIGIVLISVGLILIINLNTKKVIMQNGAMLALTQDGESITKFPSSFNYRVEIDCRNGRGKVLPEDGTWKFSVDNIKGNITCNIDFYTRTANDKLVNKIISLAETTQGEGKLVHEEFSLNGILEQAEYINETWTWRETDKSWTSTNKADNSTSEISFTPKLNGNYQICYIQSSEKNYDYGKVYKNNTEILSLKGKEVTSFECESLGNLTTSDTIKVTYSKDNSQSNGTDEMTFYIKFGTNEMIDAGYRYEGTNPNNYIWFNNEMWRIIGSIPTKIDASGTTTNLVKIIKKDSFGGIDYDAKSSGATGAWGSNTLYTLLNEYYYGKKDGTNTAYCDTSKCDYRASGISSESTDYYGRMIKNVYWNTSASNQYVPAMGVYLNEKSKQTVQGRIGLMSVSDYGYAASSTYHDLSLSEYDTSEITLSNWLYSQAGEWTSIQAVSNVNYVNTVYESSMVSGSIVNNYYLNYRPVVYLNENIYVISGNGTEANPYIIGM